MSFIYNLPLDVWFTILEHLSLAELASIYNAFGTTASDALFITKTHAMKVISTMFAIGTVRINPCFANNGACYKFHVKNPRDNTDIGKIMDNPPAVESRMHHFLVP